MNAAFAFFFPLLQEALTPQKCIHHIIVRGLVRIRCVQEMERILYFMTRKGLINTGILSVSTDQYLLPKEYHNVSSCNNPCVISTIKWHGLFFCSLSLTPISCVGITCKSKHISYGPHPPLVLTETAEMGVLPARFVFPQYLWNPPQWIWTSYTLFRWVGTVGEPMQYAWVLLVP